MIIKDNTHTNSLNTQIRIVAVAIMIVFSNLAVDTYISIFIYIHKSLQYLINTIICYILTTFIKNLIISLVDFLLISIITPSYEIAMRT